MLPLARRLAPLVAAVALALAPSVAAAAPRPPAVRHDVARLRGLVVDRYTWWDSRRRPRTVSLVRYGQAGGGGYAIRMTYQVSAGRGRWRTIRADAPTNGGDAGFGYFVSHEAYRTFDAAVCGDGTASCPIASLHGEDDSPLGRYLPGTGQQESRTRNRAVHVFRTSYPHWGTVAPMVDPTGGVTPSDPAAHRRYVLPVTIRWTFKNGRDDPRWSVVYDLRGAPADTVSVDVRGPYGVLDWDGAADGALTRIEWGDRVRFRTLGSPVASSTPWSWTAANGGARYNLLVAGRYAMGLVDLIPQRRSRTGNGYADARGMTSATFPGCVDSGWAMPCDWQWTYQSVQYEDFGDHPTTMRKLAWGSAPYLGQSRTTDDEGSPIVGYPVIRYGVRVVLEASGGARVRRLAAATR